MHDIFRFEAKVVALLARRNRPFAGLCTAVSWLFSHDGQLTRYVRCIEWNECCGMTKRLFKSDSASSVVIEHALTEDDLKHWTEQTQTGNRHDDISKIIQLWTDLSANLSSLRASGYKSLFALVSQSGAPVSVHSSGMEQNVVQTAASDAARLKSSECLNLGRLLSVNRDSPKLELAAQLNLFNCLPGVACTIEKLDTVAYYSSLRNYPDWSREVSARNLALRFCEDKNRFQQSVLWALSLMLDRDSLRKSTRLSGRIEPVVMSGRRRKSGPSKGWLNHKGGRSRKAHAFDTDMGLPPESLEEVPASRPDAPRLTPYSPINAFIMGMSANGFMLVLEMTTTHVAVAWNAVSYPRGKQVLERSKFVRTEARMQPGEDPVITCASCKPFAYSLSGPRGPGCVHTKAMLEVIRASRLILSSDEDDQTKVRSNRFLDYVSKRSGHGREVVLISHSRDGRLVRNFLTPITEAKARAGECSEVAVCTIRCRGKETLLVCRDFRWVSFPGPKQKRNTIIKQLLRTTQ